MTTRIEEIYAFVLPEMEANGIETTDENIHIFLTGLYDGWREDRDDEFEKLLYMMALSAEIFNLKMKLLFPRIMK